MNVKAIVCATLLMAVVSFGNVLVACTANQSPQKAESERTWPKPVAKPCPHGFYVSPDGEDACINSESLFEEGMDIGYAFELLKMYWLLEDSITTCDDGDTFRHLESLLSHWDVPAGARAPGAENILKHAAFKMAENCSSNAYDATHLLLNIEVIMSVDNLYPDNSNHLDMLLQVSSSDISDALNPDLFSSISRERGRNFSAAEAQSLEAYLTDARINCDKEGFSTKINEFLESWAVPKGSLAFIGDFSFGRLLSLDFVRACSSNKDEALATYRALRDKFANTIYNEDI